MVAFAYPIITLLYIMYYFFIYLFSFLYTSGNWWLWTRVCQCLSVLCVHAQNSAPLFPSPDQILLLAEERMSRIARQVQTWSSILTTFSFFHFPCHEIKVFQKLQQFKPHMHSNWLFRRRKAGAQDLHTCIREEMTSFINSHLCAILISFFKMGSTLFI